MPINQLNEQALLKRLNANVLVMINANLPLFWHAPNSKSQGNYRLTFGTRHKYNRSDTTRIINGRRRKQVLKENCPSQECFREKLVRGHLRIHQALIGLYFIVFWAEKALPSNRERPLSVMGMAVALQSSEKETEWWVGKENIVRSAHCTPLQVQPIRVIENRRRVQLIVRSEKAEMG